MRYTTHCQSSIVNKSITVTCEVTCTNHVSPHIQPLVTIHFKRNTQSHASILKLLFIFVGSSRIEMETSLHACVLCSIFYASRPPNVGSDSLFIFNGTLFPVRIQWFLHLLSPHPRDGDPSAVHTAFTAIVAHMINIHVHRYTTRLYAPDALIRRFKFQVYCCSTRSRWLSDASSNVTPPILPLLYFLI